MVKQHLLFVCRYNRFRSVLAHAFFTKYNTNKQIIVKSAAPIKGRHFSQEVKQLAREFQLTLKNKPEGLTSDLMAWQDITIIVADDVSETLFDKNKAEGKHVIVWGIQDTATGSLEEMRLIAQQIEQKVIQLVAELSHK